MLDAVMIMVSMMITNHETNPGTKIRTTIAIITTNTIITTTIMLLLIIITTREVQTHADRETRVAM